MRNWIPSSRRKCLKSAPVITRTPTPVHTKSPMAIQVQRPPRGILLLLE